jgi:hypothetical protein
MDISNGWGERKITHRVHDLESHGPEFHTLGLPVRRGIVSVKGGSGGNGGSDGDSGAGTAGSASVGGGRGSLILSFNLGLNHRTAFPTEVMEANDFGTVDAVGNAAPWTAG